MRIYGSNGTAALATSASARRGPTNGGFSVKENDGAPAAAASSSLRTVGGIDALIALQGVDDATERRRHAVKRGRLALDALDELKVGLLGGELTPATLQKLKVAAAHLKNGSGDGALDGVLAEIEPKSPSWRPLRPCAAPGCGRDPARATRGRAAGRTGDGSIRLSFPCCPYHTAPI